MKWLILGMLILSFVLIIIWLIREKLSQFLNFLLRIVFGFLAIYIANMCLEYWEISVSVGYNPISALTLGTLGISGFLLLYGIALGKIL